MKQSNDYYNKERKEEFIVDTMIQKDDSGEPLIGPDGEYVVLNKRQYTVARASFNKLAVFEKEFDKDFCELKRGIDENFISSLYNKWLSNLSDIYSIAVHTVLRNYVVWCYNNDIITRVQYFRHPFYEKTIMKWNYNDNKRAQSASLRVKNQIDYISDNKSDRDLGNYIFHSEDEFFDYIDTLFGNPQNIMYAAACSLLYYGFSNDEIRYIRKDEVDEILFTVQNVKIDNDIAWKLICAAKHTDSYILEYESGEKTVFLTDTPYLIRGRPADSEGEPISKAFIKRIYSREKEMVNSLPIQSGYKNILIKVSLIKKLRAFYQMMREEQEYGIDYVMDKILNEEYCTPIKYREYQIMRARIGK